ncbi:MAG: Hsp20 family protein [Thermoguttaceae bacterium]|jgi:HSP20 family protein
MARAQKNPSPRRRGDQSSPGDRAGDFDFHLGGFLGKFGSLVEKLADLAQTGQNLSRTGEIKGLDPQGKLRGVYGFSVKTALGDRGEQEVKIEPFGNIHRGSSGGTVVEDVREPLFDVHEEEDHVLVLAEIPGVSKKDVQLEFSGDCLTILAQHGEKRYRKEVTLPGTFSEQAMRWECTNGILKIRLER